MEIINILNADGNRYIGCNIPAKSPEIDIIKSMPKRWWNNELKMWLVVYEKESWQLLVEKFGRQNLVIKEKVIKVNIKLFSENGIKEKEKKSSQSKHINP